MREKYTVQEYFYKIYTTSRRYWSLLPAGGHHSAMTCVISCAGPDEVELASSAKVSLAANSSILLQIWANLKSLDCTRSCQGSKIVRRSADALSASSFFTSALADSQVSRTLIRQLNYEVFAQIRKNLSRLFVKAHELTRATPITMEAWASWPL